ncbi:signal peptide peptidase SppA [Sphingobacterium hungaricum]
MKSFFKYVLATITGIVISTFILLAIFVGIITSMVSSVGSSKEAVVAKNSVLYLSLNFPITDRTEPNPFGDLSIPGYGNVKSLGLNDIVGRIRGAKEDSNIKGIYLNPTTIQTGFSSLQAIRDALLDFKSSGKFIYAYSDVYSQKAYYLASVADKIYVNPQGSLDFRGLASSVMFMKDALDKIGVEMQVIKVGTYKSAVEPFLMNQMSDANRLQVNSYLNSIYSQFLTDISDNRNIAVDSLKSIANNYLIRNADDALTYKFVDGVKYKDELLAEFREKLGIDAKKDIPTVSILDYTPTENVSSSSERIAVLYAYGSIVDGEGVVGEIGGDKFSRELRKLRLDDRVKAVVLRVNSGGGSGLASEIIWREVSLLKAVKPVIVSMGDYAASGGYYIAAAADSIFADETTLTGSIGVFGVIPNLQGLLNNKLGLNFDVVKTGKFADVGADPDKPLSAEEKAIYQIEVNRFYDLFMKRVADGRKISIAQVDSIGQGRVWTGQQALGLGLVDKIGGIDQAIAAAAKKANLDSYKISNYPSVDDTFSSILSTSKEKIKLWFIEDEIGEYHKYLKSYKDILNQTGIQAKIPYTVEIY